MEAGRELDALIAWKVMGWIFNDAQILVPPEHPDWVEARLPNYSTDIAAAWKIIDRMRALGWYWHVAHFTDGTQAGFVMYGVEGSNYKEYADTAPLAICLAALKAVGHEID